LDRMSFNFSFPGMDIYLGRQAFGWGDSRLISPLDVLTPFQFDDLDKEERAGVDAARFLVSFGTFNEFSGGYVFGDKGEFRNSAVYLRTRLHFLDTDLKLLTLGYRNHLMAGFSSTRSLGGAGIWLEGAWTACGVLDSGWESSNDFFRLTLGSDYNFNEKFYGYAEYHYSSAGKGDPEDYLSNFKTPAYESGGVYLMGRHYLGLGGNFQIMPLLNLGFAGMWNISDLSFSVMPSLEYNVAEDIYISWGGVLGLGKGPAFKSIDPGSIALESGDIGIGSILEEGFDPGSEFGMMSNMCYMSMRFYF
ncbi:MAG: hypothetical protein ACOCSE_06180, partial [Chitinivibrionales bacterium]